MKSFFCSDVISCYKLVYSVKGFYVEIRKDVLVGEYTIPAIRTINRCDSVMGIYVQYSELIGIYNEPLLGLSLLNEMLELDPQVTSHSLHLSLLLFLHSFFSSSFSICCKYSLSRIGVQSCIFVSSNFFLFSFRPDPSPTKEIKKLLYVMYAFVTNAFLT